MAKVDAARIGDHRHANLSIFGRMRSKLLEKAHPGFAQGFGIRHDVRLADFDQIGCVEKLTDLQHMLHCPPAWFAELTIQHGLFFKVELHD